MDLNWCFCGALPDTMVDNTSSQHNTDGADDETDNSYKSVFTIDTTLVIIPNEDVVVKKETAYYNIDTTMKKFMRRWRMSYRRNNNKRRRGHNKRNFFRWTHRSSSKKNIQLDHPIYTQDELDNEFDKLLTLDLLKSVPTISESAKLAGDKTLATGNDYESSKDAGVKRSQSFLRIRSISWTKRRSSKAAMETDYTDARDDETINCMYSYDERENVEVKSMLYHPGDIKQENSSITNKNKEVVEPNSCMCDLSNALTYFMENGCGADDMARLSRNPYDKTLKSKNPDDTLSDSSSGVSTTTGEKLNFRSKLGYEEIY